MAYTIVQINLPDTAANIAAALTASGEAKKLVAVEIVSASRISRRASTSNILLAVFDDNATHDATYTVVQTAASDTPASIKTAFDAQATASQLYKFNIPYTDVQRARQGKEAETTLWIFEKLTAV
jgi:hypothetical protein